MKYSSVIWGLAASFTIFSAKAAQKCSPYLGLMSDQDVKVEELRDRSWISASDSNMEAAGEFEKELKSQGLKLQPEELERVLGGSKVHLKKTTLPSGLIFVTIHKTEGGTEIFDAHTYLGLISCNCGAIHDSPAVSMAPIIEDTPLGAGFTLKSVDSSDKSFSTTATIKKEYDLPGQDGSVELIYSISPMPGSRNLDHLWLEYKQTSFRTTPQGDIVRGRVQKIRVDYDKGDLRDFEIIIADNLTYSKWEAAFDQVHLVFDPNGKLKSIAGISQSSLPNLAWSNITDLPNFISFLDAIKKGQNRWFNYQPEEPQAALIFKTVFGRDLAELGGLSFSAIKVIVDSAKAERPLFVNSLFQFKPR